MELRRIAESPIRLPMAEVKVILFGEIYKMRVAVRKYNMTCWLERT